ncbi:MAG TPA: AAA family ATPase [Chthonomonadaceae bacterium]|nr:AAA family ATPase [Chthonomonadaceae bacterium]
MIRRVKIEGYKSLKSVEVGFKRLTIIFGPNAAGKSNLFDALALLSRMVTQRNLREAFEGHRGTPLETFFIGDSGLDQLLKQEMAQFRMEVDVQLSDAVVEYVEKLILDLRRGLDSPRESSENGSGSPSKQRLLERRLRYSLTIQIMTDTGHLRVMDERLCALNSDGTEKQSRKAFVERVDNKFSLRMEGQAHPSYHVVGLDHTLVSTPLYAPHYPHITAFREELSRWRFYYLEPKRLMRSDNPLQEVRSLDPTGSNLASFYNSLRAYNKRQFDNVNRTLPMLLPRVEKIDVEPNRNGELQLRVFEAGVPFPASLVSEGTLRILGLLAITSALTPATVVGYEEPENGVHPRRLQLIATLLKNTAEATDTQFLINTHSPEFPGYFGPEAALINCRKEGASTLLDPIRWDSLFKESSIEDGFAEEEMATVSSLAARIRRGDYSG